MKALELHFLGTGGAFYPAEGSNGAFFRRGDDLYLLDCGESCFATLKRLGLLEVRGGRLIILLTHLHADHCGSLGTTCLYAASRFSRVTVVHPHPQADTLLSLMGIRDGVVDRVERWEDGGLRVRPVPVRHLHLPSFGYLLDDGEETLYYSGDATDIPADILAGFEAGEIARMYQDCLYDGTSRTEHPAHMPFALLCERIRLALRDRVTVMHFNRDFRQQAQDAGFRCAYAQRA